jgi:hypothetical protein
MNMKKLIKNQNIQKILVENPKVISKICKVRWLDGTCSCSVSIPLLFVQECSTTCLSSKRLCGGHFCTRTSVFNAFLYLTGGDSELTTQTFLSVNNKDCEKLAADCIASSAIGAVAKIGAAAGLATAALSSGTGAAAKLLITANHINYRTGNEDGMHSNNTSRRTSKNLKHFDSLLKSNSLFDETGPFLESSIVEEKNLKRFSIIYLFGLFGGQQGVRSLTACTYDDPSPSARTIGLKGAESFSISTILTRTYSKIDEERCEILESQCNAIDTLAKARQPVVDVATLSVGLAAGAVEMP